jgi:hypothetical protein
MSVGPLVTNEGRMLVGIQEKRLSFICANLGS